MAFLQFPFVLGSHPCSSWPVRSSHHQLDSALRKPFSVAALSIQGVGLSEVPSQLTYDMNHPKTTKNMKMWHCGLEEMYCRDVQSLVEM